MKKNIMKRAHELAKGMIGDYRARMSIALRLAWEEVQEVSNTVDAKMITISDWYARSKGIRQYAKKQYGFIEQETEKAIFFKGCSKVGRSDVTLKDINRKLKGSGTWYPKSAITIEDFKMEE